MSHSIEIMTIGDELLRGELVDSNSAWIAEQLRDVGLTATRLLSVGDGATPLISAFKESLHRANVLIATGGLGPTTDDRTAAALAEASGCPLHLDEEVRQRIQQRFQRLGLKYTPNNDSQALFPEGASALGNTQGTAPGIHLGTGSCEVFCLPGVPREMKAMFEQHVRPWLMQHLDARASHKRTFKLFALGESQVDARLDGLQQVGGQELSIHYRAHSLEVQVTLLSEQLDVLERAAAEVEKRLAPHIFAKGPGSLAQAVVDRLARQGLTLAVAESCTGGLVGDLITQVSGSSKVFKGGVIAYANHLKQRLLDVPESVLIEHGAVSEVCVQHMARAILKKAEATHAIAISGIAGPDGGSEGRPVGTVHIALANSIQTVTLCRRLPFDRQRNKLATAYLALWLLYCHMRDGHVDIDVFGSRWNPSAPAK